MSQATKLLLSRSPGQLPGQRRPFPTGQVTEPNKESATGAAPALTGSRGAESSVLGDQVLAPLPGGGAHFSPAVVGMSSAVITRRYSSSSQPLARWK